MKKYLMLVFLVIIAVGCWQPKEQKEILVKINNYEITKNEFREEFRESSFARDNTLAARKEFLDNLINRVLILQDAQKRNLDKDKSFLKMVQKFWEQSLLRLALDKKTKEIAGSASVSEKAIEEAYNQLLKEGKTDKSYQEMHNQLKWEISKEKESAMFNAWILKLRKNAAIKINYDLLQR